MHNLDSEDSSPASTYEPADTPVSGQFLSAAPPARHPLEDTDRVICQNFPLDELIWDDIQRALNCNEFSPRMFDRIRNDPKFRSSLEKVAMIRQEALNEFARQIREL